MKREKNQGIEEFNKNVYSKNNTSISLKVKEMRTFKEKIKRELKKHNYSNLELDQIEIAIQEIREERNKEKEKELIFNE